MVAGTRNELGRYLSDIGKHPVLDRAAEFELASEYVRTGSASVRDRLVRSNLRFVIKVANEYRGYGLPLLDLVQEGNLGLLKAVEKFDPDKGNRLISYGVWWIRAYIQAYVMRSWSLVKVGTTQAERKLFFRLRGELAERDDGERQTMAQIAEKLGVKEHEVVQMSGRMKGRDGSLNLPAHEDGRETLLDNVRDEASEDISDEVADSEEKSILHQYLADTVKKLSARERFIMSRRLMADEPLTLQQIGEEFGVSRERARQIESALLEKMRVDLEGSALEEARVPALV